MGKFLSERIATRANCVLFLDHLHVDSVYTDLSAAFWQSAKIGMLTILMKDLSWPLTVIAYYRR